ncbi:MAG TPA: M56 family metallopeptidase [Sphingomicrobium sp.]|nr:M56 family metallopeptidase [Sphingomicrobium sp.]
MDWILPLAAKSFLIAGGALLLLRLLRNRSAADRSWIAHLALAGLILLPVATVALPTFDVAGPEFLVGSTEPLPAKTAAITDATAVAAGDTAAPAVKDDNSAGGATIDWPFWSYVAPAALLILLTLIALGRLFVLKARATVLVDAPWLTALARAQHRMGFKHGTALLTSNELPSPISWGVVRPVILLNSEAADSHDEAEAIITHELAHVANLDWAKLMLARVAVALFWFNPFVWVLAREAHQLREEAADDAVLSTDIEDTDYARLLVGVARHECRGILIGAHGVAPGKKSLARRVKRVLDGAAKRAPGGWRWGSAVAFFAAGMAVPVAALNLVPANQARLAGQNETVELSDGSAYYPGEAVSSATSAATQSAVRAVTERFGSGAMFASGTSITSHDGLTVVRNANGSSITISPPDSKGHRKVVMRNEDGNVLTYSDVGKVPFGNFALAGPLPPAPPTPPHPPRTAIDRAIEMKAVGVTAEYAAAIRAAVPHLRLSTDDLVEFKALGVTPKYVGELAASGYRNLGSEEIVDARALGITGDYIRSITNAGYPNLTMDQLSDLRAVGVTAEYINRIRRSGLHPKDLDQLIEMKAVGVDLEDIQRDDGG